MGFMLFACHDRALTRWSTGRLRGAGPTVQWGKFVMPEEMALLTQRAGLEMQMLTGMYYNPITARSAQPVGLDPAVKP
eukprot:906408-Pyramimonas_sp.AAC.1